MELKEETLSLLSYLKGYVLGKNHTENQGWLCHGSEDWLDNEHINGKFERKNTLKVYEWFMSKVDEEFAKSETPSFDGFEYHYAVMYPDHRGINRPGYGSPRMNFQEANILRLEFIKSLREEIDSL